MRTAIWESNTMMTTMNKTLKICVGICGLAGVISLGIYQFLCFYTIFGTPSSEGQGDNYDAMLKTGGCIGLIALVFILLPIFLLLYPWLNLFGSMMLNRTRSAFFGLFVARGMTARILSIVLTILNMVTIILLTYDIMNEDKQISTWDYTVALCPDNSIIYIGKILLIITFWGTVHLIHGVYHHDRIASVCQN